MVFVVRDNVLREVIPSDVRPSDIPVYTMRECAVRVQNPADVDRGGDPNHPERSIISPGRFRASQGQVNGTLQDFSNIHRNNLALWLDGETALFYAGMRRLEEFPMTPQPGLNSPYSLVSVIPPPHFNDDGLTRVYPSSDAVRASGSRINPFGIDGVARSIFGLTGTAVYDALSRGQRQESDGFVAFGHTPGDGFDEGNRRIAFIVDIRSRALEGLVGRVINFDEGASTSSHVAR